MDAFTGKSSFLRWFLRKRLAKGGKVTCADPLMWSRFVMVHTAVSREQRQATRRIHSRVPVSSSFLREVYGEAAANTAARELHAIEGCDASG